MGYIYRKINGKTYKSSTDSDERIDRIISKLDSPILSFIPKDGKEGMIDYISSDVQSAIDYAFKSHNNTHKKSNPVDVYVDSMNILINTIFNLKTKEDIIDLENENSLANAICRSYKIIYKDAKANEYIKRLNDNYKEVKTEEELLIIYGRAIERILRKYIRNTINALDTNELKALLKHQENTYKVLSTPSIDFNSNSDENLKQMINRVSAFIIKEINVEKATGESLCANCPATLSMKCSRVLDSRPIYAYPFITDGIEITEEKESYSAPDEEGYLKRIAASDVKNYAAKDVTKNVEEVTKTYKVFKCRKLYDYQQRSKRQ